MATFRNSNYYAHSRLQNGKWSQFAWPFPILVKTLPTPKLYQNVQQSLAPMVIIDLDGIIMNVMAKAFSSGVIISYGCMICNDGVFKTRMVTLAWTAGSKLLKPWLVDANDHFKNIFAKLMPIQTGSPKSGGPKSNSLS